MTEQSPKYKHLITLPNSEKYSTPSLSPQPLIALLAFLIFSFLPSPPSPSQLSQPLIALLAFSFLPSLLNHLSPLSLSAFTVLLAFSAFPAISVLPALLAFPIFSALPAFPAFPIFSALPFYCPAAPPNLLISKLFVSLPLYNIHRL